ncbi:MAG: protein kinase [Deltaproteobacteria bacterium]|nr:protein kinase [Deltaproteobacteria bacterium]
MRETTPDRLGTGGQPAEGGEATVDPRLGTVLDTYRLDALIGDGSITRVYLGTDRRGAQVAVKVLDSRHARDPRMRWRFFRDASISDQISHPASLKYLRKDVTREGDPFVVVELIRGAHGAAIISDGSAGLSAVTVAYLGHRAADFLAAAHARRILHRGVSPECIVITNTGRLRVTGFAGAFVAEEQAEQNSPDLITAPSAWRAPELVGLCATPGDPRSDVFGLAATLYSLLTGHPPKVWTEEGWQFSLEAEQLELAAGPTLAHILLQGLSESPLGRQPSCAILRDQLADFLAAEGAPVVTGETHPAEAALAEIGAKFAAAERDIQSIDAKSWETASNLRDLFRMVEHTLYSMHRHGWEHAETESRVAGLLKSLRAIVGEDVDGVHWQVRPYSFEFNGDSVWEPAPPHDAVPYNLFDAGFRELSLLPGFDEEELRSWLTWLYINPSVELAEEDDLATAFWNLELPHARAKLVSAVILQDLKEFEVLDRELSEMQTEALATLRESIQTRMRKLGAKQEQAAPSRRLGATDFDISSRPAAVAIPEEMLAILRDELFDSEAELGDALEHHLGRTLLAVIVDAGRHNDEASIIGHLDNLLEDWARQKAWRRILRLHSSLLRHDPEGQAAAPLLARFLEPAILAAVLRGVSSDPDPEIQVPIRLMLESLHTLLEQADDGCFEEVLEAVKRCGLPDALDMLLHHISRFSEGRETAIAAILPDVFPALGVGLIRVLAMHPTRASLNALLAAYANGAPHVRLEAMDVRARLLPQEVTEELRPLLDDRDPRVRARAHEIARKAKLFGLASTVMEKLNGLSFHDMPLVDRHALVTTLFTIAPEQAEAFCIELAATHGFLENQSLDVSRKLAVDLLAEHARTTQAIEAIKDAAKGRWWNAPELQAAAKEAVIKLTARLGPGRG